MLPPAPGRFETTTGCFQVSLMRWATARATRSTEPPAGKGAITVTGLSGKFCANATGAAAASSNRKKRLGMQELFWRRRAGMTSLIRGMDCSAIRQRSQSESSAMPMLKFAPKQLLKDASMKLYFTPRLAFLVGFLIAGGLIAFALYLQYFDFQDPCPLCI